MKALFGGLVLSIVMGCGGAATAKDESGMFLDCNLVRNSLNQTVQRCVNDEAVCYILGNSISCLPKP